MLLVVADTIDDEIRWRRSDTLAKFKEDVPDETTVVSTFSEPPEFYAIA